MKTTLGALAFGMAVFGTAVILAGRASRPEASAAVEPPPRPDHTVVVIMENHS